MDLDWWSFGIGLAGLIVGLISGFGVAWLSKVSGWFRKERRLSRNLRVHVFLVAQEAKQMEYVQRCLTGVGGMLSKNQVSAVSLQDLEIQMSQERRILVVVHANVLQQALDQNVVCKSMPLLIYCPPDRNVDRNFIAERLGGWNIAMSNYPLRLMSDIWAAMCTLQLNSETK